MTMEPGPRLCRVAGGVLAALLLMLLLGAQYDPALMDWTPHSSPGTTHSPAPGEQQLAPPGEQQLAPPGEQDARPRTLMLWTRYYTRSTWFLPVGSAGFAECGASRCEVLHRGADWRVADVLVFHEWDVEPHALPPRHPPAQRWVWWTEESTLRQRTHFRHQLLQQGRDVTDDVVDGDALFNGTATYTHDADVTWRYGVTRRRAKPLLPAAWGRHFADQLRQKRHLVLWYVSHCNTPYTRARSLYAAALQRHLPVDVFGKCGRPDPCTGKRRMQCSLARRRRYKFYLAFENSACQEYITEKFWISLITGSVPVVMGTVKDDYAAVAPPHSFIHVADYASPRDLAQYLHALDADDAAYMRYHEWREHYVISSDVSSFACGLCRYAHNRTTVRRPRTVRLSAFWNVSARCQPYPGVTDFYGDGT